MKTELPAPIEKRLATLSQTELQAIKELKSEADRFGESADETYSYAEILKDRGEVNRANYGLRSASTTIRGRRYTLAQILCLCGSDANAKRGKWSDEDVRSTQGMYGDAEWTVQAMKIVDAITSRLSID